MPETAAATYVPRVLDAHLHLWDPGTLRYPWLDATPLDRPFLPNHLPSRPTAAVVVQADALDRQAEDEVRWLSSVAQSWPGIRGIVAHAPLEHGEGAVDRLRRLAGHDLVVGVRRLLQDDNWVLRSDDLVAGVRALADFSWPFDVCVRADQLSGVARLARDCPDVVLVLDHLGKPAIGSDRSTWLADLREVAAAPNTVCKLSGLTSEAPGGTPTDASLPYLFDALDVFGPGRCMFGSDWPVASTTVGYDAWLQLVVRAVTEVAAGGGEVVNDLRAVLWETAARVYALR